MSLNSKEFLVNQGVQSNFFALWGNSIDFYKCGISVVVCDKNDLALQQLNEKDLFQLHDGDNDTKKNSNWVAIPLHDLASKLKIHSGVDLGVCYSKEFCFQAIRMDVGYNPQFKEDEYPKLKHYKKLHFAILGK